MKAIALLLALTLPPLAAAAADPWGNADPKAGKERHDQACTACHTRLYGGDGSKIYTRDNRLLSTKLGILQRVATCNAQTKTGLTPAEEADIAAYLNQQYYRFTD